MFDRGRGCQNWSKMCDVLYGWPPIRLLSISFCCLIASIWLGAHIKSIANVKILFTSSEISLVQGNIIDNVHMHLLTKLLCRKRHKKTKDAESKEEMNLLCDLFQKGGRIEYVYKHAIIMF